MCGPLWSGLPSGWPRWPRCCLLDFIFQHWPVLLIIKPDYENILKSQHALTNSNINKEIWQKGHWKHSANACVNSIAKWIEGYCIICLYFIILFAGLLYKLFPESESKWEVPCYSGLFHVPAKHISSSGCQITLPFSFTYWSLSSKLDKCHHYGQFLMYSSGRRIFNHLLEDLTRPITLDSTYSDSPHDGASCVVGANHFEWFGLSWTQCNRRATLTIW